MGKRKISHAAYAAWDYKKEIEDLNKKSQEGWQLVKGGCFKSIYEQNDQACYRYQLDYNTDIENKVLYLEMFEDQGWEYINSTFNGWHFFRKPYDPELPEEEYEIYTDSSAIPDMVSASSGFMSDETKAVMTFSPFASPCATVFDSFPHPAVSNVALTTVKVNNNCMILFFIFHLSSISCFQNGDRQPNVRLLPIPTPVSLFCIFSCINCSGFDNSSPLPQRFQRCAGLYNHSSRFFFYEDP